MALKPLQIDIVSDVVCPWCYIGKKRIEDALALASDVPVHVNWRPFFLNPWVPREGITRDEYLTAKFGSPEAYKNIAGRVVAAAEEEGLQYNPGSVKRQPNTIDCHRLILWAEAEGKAAQMKQRLMELYLRDGGDLTDSNVLVQAAADVAPRTPMRALADSLAVELLNPKTTIFFVSFLPQFVDPSASLPLWVQFLILGMVVNLLFTSSSILTVLTASYMQAKVAANGTAQRVIRAIGGTILIGLGARIALDRN